MANRRVTSNSERENNVLSKQAVVLIGSLRILARFQRAKLLVKQQVERGRLLQGRGGPALVRREHQRVGLECAGQGGQGSIDSLLLRKFHSLLGFQGDAHGCKVKHFV